MLRSGLKIKIWIFWLWVINFSLAVPGETSDFMRLQGHGGPIMGLATAETGQLASASFDNSVGVWVGQQPRWFEGHDAAVTAITYLEDDKLVTGGDDFTIWLWDIKTKQGQKLGEHKGKIAQFAVSPDGKWIASASWDGEIGLWSADGQTIRFLKGHQSGVSTVNFSKDGSTLYSGGADGTIRTWDVDSGSQLRKLFNNGFGINRLVLGHNKKTDWLAYGGVDGSIKIIDLSSEKIIANLTQDRKPVLAMVWHEQSGQLAVGDGEGYIVIFNSQDWTTSYNFHAVSRGPIWALAFSPDAKQLYAGGIENHIDVWPISNTAKYQTTETGNLSFLRKPEEMNNGERQFQRKCSICHSLTADGGRKAGPNLYHLFGRKAAVVADYPYSAALKNSELAWTVETIDRLFDIGPIHYIPGTKMPMQRITNPQDRADLIQFLQQNTQE